jgi:hypothetical protein
MQDAKVNHPSAQFLDKHQVTKVPIASHQDAVLFLGPAQDLLILCP